MKQSAQELANIAGETSRGQFMITFSSNTGWSVYFMSTKHKVTDNDPEEVINKAIDYLNKARKPNEKYVKDSTKKGQSNPFKLA